MTQVVMMKDLRDQVKEIVSEKHKSDIVFFYVAHADAFCYYGKEDMNLQIKDWKPMFKSKKFVIKPSNHRSPLIGGKQFYTFVLQTSDLEAYPMRVDILGLAFDAGPFMVSGHIYCFRTEANRDSIYKYLMGIKD